MSVESAIDKVANRLNRVLDELAVWRTRALTAEFLAEHDSMTGLLNRAGLYRAAAVREYKYVYVIDLDGLKKMNDTLGHAEGDLFIKAMATRFEMMAEIGDGVAARVGGDEFVLLTMKLVRTDSTEHFSHGWVSMGNERNLDEALAKADARMYIRKQDRKKKVNG